MINHRHATNFGRVLELNVTSTLADDLPTITTERARSNSVLVMRGKRALTGLSTP